MIEHRYVPPRKSTTRSKRLSIRISPELYAALAAAAKRDRRTVAGMAVIKLEDAFGLTEPDK